MRAPLIILAIGMLATIHLNDEMSMKGDKIDNVSSDHRLSFEFHPLEAMRAKKIPKTLPQSYWHEELWRD
jgi:hypothetical protein